MIRLIRERRPELADRLERLRQESPQKFRQVIADALIARLEETLNKAELGGPAEGGMPAPPADRAPDEKRPGPPGGPDCAPVPGGRMGPPGRPPVPPELRAEFQQLEERHGRLEDQVRALVGRLREARQRQAPEEELAGIREELGRTVNEQFETRTQLRQLELRAIEIHLSHLQRALEHLRSELSERMGRRQAIIERRLNDLFGEGNGEW